MFGALIGVFGMIGSFISTISAIVSFVNASIATLNGIVNTVTSGIDGIIKTVTGGLLDFADRILGEIFDGISVILDPVVGLIRDVEGIVSDFEDLAGQIDSLAGTSLSEAFGDFTSFLQFDFASIFDIIEELIAGAFSFLDDIFGDLNDYLFGGLEDLFGEIFSGITTFDELFDTTWSVFASSLEATTANIYGLIEGPALPLVQVPELNWDPRIETKLTKLVDSTNFYFEQAEDAYDSIVDDLNGFKDTGNGLDLGEVTQRPLTTNFLFPSEPTINRVSRGASTLYQPGGMRFMSLVQKDSLINEPEIDAQPIYPYNKYSETESGHIYETDDTPGHERLQIRHRTGTGFNVNPDGSQSFLIKGNNYGVCLQDHKLHVSGNIEIFGDNDAHISINGMCQVNVGGDAKISVGGECSLDVARDFNVTAGGDIKLHATGNIDIKCGDNNDSSRRTKRSDTAETEEDEEALYGNLKVTAQNMLACQGKNVLHNAEEGMQLYAKTGMAVNSQDGTVITSETVTMLESQGNVVMAAGGSIMQSGNVIQLNGLRVTPTKFDAPEPIDPGVFAPLIVAPHPSDTLRTYDAFTLDHEGDDTGGSSPTVQDYKTAMEQGQVSHAEVNRTPDLVVPNQVDESTRSGGGSTIPGTVPTIPSDFNPNNFGDSFYKTKLSDHIYLRDVTIGCILSSCHTPLKANSYASEEQMLRNLTALANTVLDHVHENFGGLSFRTFGRSGGPITLNCGLRNSGGQTHRRGQAADLQFSNVPKSKYFELAVNLADTLPGFDYILLEYKNTGSRNPWLHIQVANGGGSGRGGCATYFNHSKQADKLVNLGHK